MNTWPFFFLNITIWKFDFLYAIKLHVMYEYVCVALVRSMKYLMESPAYLVLLLNASCSEHCRELTVRILTQIVTKCKTRNEWSISFQVWCYHLQNLSSPSLYDVVALQFVVSSYICTRVVKLLPRGGHEVYSAAEVTSPVVCRQATSRLLNISPLLKFWGVVIFKQYAESIVSVHLICRRWIWHPDT